MIQVYFLMLTTEHLCLVDPYQDKNLGPLPCASFHEDQFLLKNVKDYLFQNYDIGFQKILGSCEKFFQDKKNKIIVFRFEEVIPQKKMKLQPRSLVKALSSNSFLENFFWESYEKIVLKGFHIPERNHVDIWAFGHNREDASYSVSLILSGQKNTTSSLLWSYDYDEEPIPQIGHISIIRDFSGDVLAILKILDVKIIPFHELSPDIMKGQGEDFLTFDHWRKNLWDYFTEECDSMGIEPDENMPIVIETFELLDRMIFFF